MKYILTITTAFLLLLLATPSVFGQAAGNEWDILNQEVMELYRTGKYDRDLPPGTSPPSKLAPGPPEVHSTEQNRVPET